MAEAGALFPSESTNTWSLDISFVKPSVSCALIAFTNFRAISVAPTQRRERLFVKPSSALDNWRVLAFRFMVWGLSPVP